MRIAVISDIHGNLVALEAVLGEIMNESIDRIVCLGDVASRGPHPRECLQTLRDIHCPIVMGNTDEWMARSNPTWNVPDDRNPVMTIELWGADQLTRDDRSFLRSFAPTLRSSDESDHSICFFHGSPRSNDENILVTTPENDLRDMLGGFDASVFIGGHTHIQMHRRQFDTVIVNAGSVGLPFLVESLDESSKHVPVAPWAEYCVIESADGRLSVDLRRTAIDVELLTERTHSSGMPYADWWLGNFALD